MTATPQVPPLGVPAKIQFSHVDPLTAAEGDGGGIIPAELKSSRPVVAQIDGDSSGVFRVKSIETLRLMPGDPDTPHHERVWTTVATVDGPGPIETRGAQAIEITVQFVCPAKPLPSYSAAVLAVAQGSPSSTLMRIPMDASVNPLGSMRIILSGGPPAGILPGQTANFQFVFESTLDHAATGSFHCTATNQPFSSGSVPVTVPSRGQATVVLPVTSAPGIRAARFDGVPFTFESPDPIAHAGIGVSIKVLDPRTVVVTTDQPPSLTLEPGSSTPCKVTAQDSGGFSIIAITSGALPADVTVDIGQARTIAQSGSGERIDEVDIQIHVAPQARFGPRADLVLPWTVPADDTHPPISGTIRFGCTIVDPQIDRFDAVWVPGSTARICQLTGGGDPEGKPHVNDTTRFALLGTDLGTSFDRIISGQRQTYFFFGDTHTGAGDQDGDPIAFTTDDNPEPNGLHLQFMMGDNQWRRLVIPGISLGNFETPTGGFSNGDRLFIFATTGVFRSGGDAFPQNSVLAGATDAHNNFDLAFFVSTRDDRVDTPQTGGKFINIAPFKVNNRDWPGVPDNAPAGGEGVFLVGSGKYRRSAPYLAYLPLHNGQIPQKTELRYLSGFGPFVPGFGPSGPPRWSAAEPDCIPLFDDQIGELSLAFDPGLGRWLLSYNGCGAPGCGILLRSAPRPWGPWSAPQMIFNSIRDGAQGKYMFECGPYGPYLIPRYSKFDPSSQETTVYYTLSNGACPDNSEPRYQVHLMKSRVKLVRK